MELWPINLFLLLCIRSFEAAPLISQRLDESAKVLTMSSLMRLSSEALTPLIKNAHLIDRSQHDKRQEIILDRSLRATYFYECPVSGRKSWYFEWRAIWRSSNQQIYLFGTKNIHKIRDLTANPPNFWGVFEGYICIPDANQFCSYVFTGRTEGTVNPDGIAMSLVTDGNVRSHLPEVSELCVNTSAMAPDTCPSTHSLLGIRICSVHHISVSVLHPPPSRPPMK